MTRLTARAALLAAAFAAPAAAPLAAEDAETPDPVALVRASAEFLAGQAAFSFGWFAMDEEVPGGREKITHLGSGDHLFRRDTGFVARVERETERRDCYYDGRAFTVAAPEEGFYATVAYDGGLDSLIEGVREKTGTDIPFYALMMSNLPELMTADLASSAYVGLTRIAGREVHHLAFSDDGQDWQIWIAADEAAPLPLMIQTVDPYTQGWPTLTVHLLDWDLAPEAAPEAFAFVPAEGDTAAAFPRLLGAEADGAAPAAD